MADHLPILQIVVPLISAPICLLLRRRMLAWAFATAVGWTVLGIAVLLLIRVLDAGTISYALGSWSAPWGIEYRIDTVNAYILVLVAFVGAVVLLYAPPSAAHEISLDRHYLFYAAYLLCLTGLLGIAITGDAFNLFVFLEISSLSTYALISLGRDRRALTASYQYLVMGTIGATFILIGVGLLYMATGTLNMADLAVRLGPVLDTRTVLAAFAFLGVGLCLKLALFPLHMWLPNAYCYAPSMVTALLAATATKVSIYVFLRFVFTIFGPRFAFDTVGLQVVLLPLSLLGIFAASTVAIFQKNIKRMLAYSSVAQVGYIMLGVGLVSVSGAGPDVRYGPGSLNGLTAGIVHLFNHAVMKGALFLGMGCIALRVGSVQLDDMHGLGRRMPVTMAAVVLGGLSLIGVPLTVGFISKWYLVLAALEKGWWPIAVLVLLGSLLAVIYIWRVVEVAYFREPAKSSGVTEAPLLMQIPMWILIAAALYFGVSTSLTLGIARQAAGWLMGIAP